MREILYDLTTEDYRVLIGIIQGPLKPCTELKADVDALESLGEAEIRQRLVDALDREIRYLGSSDLAYQFRRMTGSEPGIPFGSIIQDTARYLKVPMPTLDTDREKVIFLAQDYATHQFGKLPEDEQLRLLEELGVARDRAVTFLKKASGVFAGPVLVEAFWTDCGAGTHQDRPLRMGVQNPGETVGPETIRVYVCSCALVDQLDITGRVDLVAGMGGLGFAGTSPP